MKLSIIMPVYNEENTITKIIDLVQNVKLIKGIKKELIIIEDYSTDSTFKKIMQAKKKYKNIKVIKHKRNQGKGTAIRSGIKHITGDIIIIQDADLEYDPKDYNLLIKPIIEKKAKVVYGSRILKKTNKPYTCLSFYIGGQSITWITNLLYKTHLTDEPTCYKVFKTDILKSLNLKCKRFEFCPEVTARVAKKKIKILELPISYYPRSIKEGKKIKWQDWVEGVWTLLKYRFFD